MQKASVRVYFPPHMEDREEELQMQKVKWAEGIKPIAPLIFSTVET